MNGIMAAELAQCVTGDSNWPGEQQTITNEREKKKTLNFNWHKKVGQ